MSSTRDRIQYSRATRDQESSESLLSDEEVHVQQPEKRAKPWRRVLMTLTYISGTLLACFLTGLTGFYWNHDLDGVCARHTSEYSPLVEMVTYHEQPLNGSFMKKSVFRKDPGPEVDAAWESLGINNRVIRLAPEDAYRAGLAPDYVKINEKHGGGYPANIEGFHHLHCLNVLRQTLYYNYEHYRDLGTGTFKNDEFIVKTHVTHCLDILRQHLMCTLDVGVFGQVWLYPENPEPFVDFNTQHRCRNFEQIRQWAEKHQLPMKVPSDYLQPPKEEDRIYTEMP